MQNQVNLGTYGIKYVLMDIEGTISDIQFVKNVLFPYSYKHIPTFVEQNATDPDVQAVVRETKEHIEKETGRKLDDRGAVDQLLTWIRADIKAPPLKKIQGMVWKQGFENKEYVAHLYPEVLEAWQQWKGAGLTLGIYSSGSLAAQKLFFAHTEKGDVSSYLSHYFDLAIGSKLEGESYRKISRQLERKPQEILFLSDIEGELRAASAAQLRVVQVVRPGTHHAENFIAVDNLCNLKF